MLGVVEVDIHAHGQQGHHQDVQQVFLPADLGQPAGLGGLVDDADLARALGDLPDDDEEGHQLRCHVVHHQGEQRLVGIPLGLEDGGDHAPDGAGGHTGEDHDGDEQVVWQLVAQQDHAGRGGKTAHQHLALAADVPKAHFERRRHSDGHAQQNGQILKEDPGLSGGAESALKNGDVDADGVLAGEEHGDDGAHHQCQQDGCAPDAPGRIPGQGFSLGDMEARIFFLYVCLTHGLRLLPSGSSACPRRVWWPFGRLRCR